MRRLAVIWVTLFFLALSLSNVAAQPDKNVCAVYFTYVGCPHCAYTDPVALVELTEKYHNLVVIEYEFVLEPENSYVLYAYNDEYGCGTGVPLVLFDKERNVVGDTPILQNMEKMIEKGTNNCPLVSGSASFEDLDLTDLPGKPKVWAEDRILIKSGEGGDSEVLKELLTGGNLTAVLERIRFQTIEPEPVLLSGIRFSQLDVLRSVEFEHAIRIDNWIFQWNGEGALSGEPDDNVSGTEPGDNAGGNSGGIKVDWHRMIIFIISAIILICMITLIYMKVKLNA